MYPSTLTLLHSEQPKLYGVLVVLSEIGLTKLQLVLLTWIKMEINIYEILVPESYFELVFFIIVLQSCHPHRLSESCKVH